MSKKQIPVEPGKVEVLWLYGDMGTVAKETNVELVHAEWEDCKNAGFTARGQPADLEAVGARIEKLVASVHCGDVTLSHRDKMFTKSPKYELIADVLRMKYNCAINAVSQGVLRINALSAQTLDRAKKALERQIKDATRTVFVGSEEDEDTLCNPNISTSLAGLREKYGVDIDITEQHGGPKLRIVGLQDDVIKASMEAWNLVRTGEFGQDFVTEFMPERLIQVSVLDQVGKLEEKVPADVKVTARWDRIPEKEMGFNIEGPRASVKKARGTIEKLVTSVVSNHAAYVNHANFLSSSDWLIEAKPYGCVVSGARVGCGKDPGSYQSQLIFHALNQKTLDAFLAAAPDMVSR